MKKGASRPAPATTKTATKATAIAAVIVAVILSAGVWAFLQWRESSAAARIPRSACRAVEGCRRAPGCEVRGGSRSADVAGRGRRALRRVSRRHVFRGSRSLLRAGHGLEPAQWRWRYYRALIQSERGGGESLVETLRGVVAQAPDFGPAFLRLGDALFKARQYDAARQAWEQRESGRRARGRAARASSCRRGAAVGLCRCRSGAHRARAGRDGPGTRDPRARRHRYAAIQLGAASARRRVPFARTSGRGGAAASTARTGSSRTRRTRIRWSMIWRASRATARCS